VPALPPKLAFQGYANSSEGDEEDIPEVVRNGMLQPGETLFQSENKPKTPKRGILVLKVLI